MSTLFQPTALVGAIAIALGFSATTQAEDQTAAKASLDTIVVTASRSEENIKDVPARISIIEPKILEQSPIASLPDLLKTDAAINVVQSGGMGQLADSYLRGASSNQTLFLRDGVRLNTATTGAASLGFIDTTDIKQIEVLKGPASVLYGTDAIAGVIQLVSKVPEKNATFVTGEIGENSTYKSIVGADLAQDGFYTQIRGQRMETDGTSITNLKQAGLGNAAYDQKGMSFKVGVEKENYAASANYSLNQGTAGYNDCSSADNINNFGYCPGAVYNRTQDFKNEVINLKGRVNVTADVAVNAHLSQFKDDLDQNQINPDQSYDYVHSTTQEADLNTKWQFTPTQNFLVGVTQQKIDGDAISWQAPYHGSVNSTGYYAQHQYNGHGLNTQVGVRLEDNDKYGTHTVGQGSIRYQLLPLTSVYANIGTAFRSPTLNELYGTYGNANLEPEKSLTYEIGLDQKLNHGLTTGFSLYETKVENLIASATTPPFLNANVKEASFKGGEAYLNWANDDLFFKTSYAYIKSQDNTTSTDLARRPRQSLTLTTGLENPVYGLSASLVARSRAKVDYNQTASGYATVNLNAYWNVNPNVKLFTNIENVGDVRYETASAAQWGDGIYYINGGRLASAGVTFKY